MSDEEQEIPYDDQELIEELEQSISSNPINNTNDEQKPMRKRAQKGSSELRQSRQKFCARWQLEFPWLRPNKVNDSVGYCTICMRELVCKKSHLERHQRSFKHMRLQGFENVFTVNEPEAELIEAHTSGYLDNNDDHDYQEEVLNDNDEHTIKVEPTRSLSVNSQAAVKTKYDIKSRSKKVMTIDANHTHYIEKENGLPRYSPMYAAPPKKDSFDLFFESISASVKSLPPKLAAEVKSKVSQVITEFELRAICEKEAEERAQQSLNGNGSSQVTNVLTIDSTINNGNNSDQQTIEGGVTHYVYTYQPKIQ